MVWVVKLEEVIDGKVVSRKTVIKPERPERLNNLADIGLSLEEGKTLLAEIQSMLVTQQFKRDREARSHCPCCGRRRYIKDYRSRQFDTLFGRVDVKRARFECPHSGCSGGTERADEELRGRSTPEFDALRAKFSAHLPYRVARDLLCELLPLSGGVAHTTLRNHTIVAAEQINRHLSETSANTETPPVSSLTLGLDTAYIRAVPDYPTRHIHVLVGEVLRDDGRQRYFAGVEDSSTRHASLIRTHLEKLGFNQQTKLTVLTDGEDALRLFARKATGGPIIPILDWFHIAMRVQHLKQLARGLSTRIPTHAAATTKIQKELERLHWRLWHGRIDAVDVSIQRLAKSIGALRRYRKPRQSDATSRKLWAMLYELKQYVRGSAHAIVDYHRRHRKGQRVSTSLVESAVNHLVNRRMNKSQQMRWSTQGAHAVLQVRAAIINGDFDSVVKQPSASAAPYCDEGLPLAA